MDQIFVYDETEVKLTGRTAVKPQQDESRRRAKTAQTPTKYEITPTEGASWKKWVNMSDLYEIDNSAVVEILDDIANMENVLNDVLLDKDKD